MHKRKDFPKAEPYSETGPESNNTATEKQVKNKTKM